MRSAIRIGVLALMAGIAYAQTPTISAVVSAASGIGAGLPNSGIAQGAILLVVGSNLGPASVVVSPTAFQNTNVGGTSASVTVAGQTVNVLMYYASATQISGVLPSNTPVGIGSSKGVEPGRDPVVLRYTGGSGHAQIGSRWR